MDTISWGWSDGEAVDRFLRLDGYLPPGDHRPLRLVPASGGAVRLNRRLDGLGTVGAFPGASMLFVEGRGRALHRRDETDHGLAHPRTLAAVQEQVVDSVSQLIDFAPRAPAALRRVDLTGELCYDRGEDGRELLYLLDCLHSARLRTAPIRQVGGPALETVYWRTPKRAVPVLRAYDKGVESQTAAPGERIRIERQVRYGSGKRPALAQFMSRDLGELYSRPVTRWLRGGVAAGTPPELMRVLTDAAVIWPSWWSAGNSWASETGRSYRTVWTPARVERILGTLGVVMAYGASWPAWNAKQRQRRMAEIREMGLVITDRPVTLDVDAHVGLLCDLWRRAA